ncbi:MAG: dTDP-4-dehydrorhamnose reductase [Terriglobales bacterium]
MRVTLFGASGLLGQELVRALSSEQRSSDQRRNDQLTALTSRNADLRDPARVDQAIRESRPDWVILAAAYTDVDGCEKNPDLAFAVNHQGAVHVAQSARAAGARLLFVSTDYVFDGAKAAPYESDDPRNPINVYGKTKAQAEEQLLALLPDICIVRTSWLFGPGGKCFPATILKLAMPKPGHAAPQISVVNDQRGSPTFTTDLAAAIAQLCHKGARGIVHATNSGDCTWYEFAKEIVRASGLAARVNPVTTADFPRPARRPANSVLSPKSLHATGIQMSLWQNALQRYLSVVR